MAPGTAQQLLASIGHQVKATAHDCGPGLRAFLQALLHAVSLQLHADPLSVRAALVMMPSLHCEARVYAHERPALANLHAPR